MKAVTIRLPEPLIAEIDAESRERGISKSDVVRERLEAGAGYAGPSGSGSFERIADLVGSVDDRMPADLSARKKHYLTLTGYGRKRTR